ncbi:MAG: MFS transporter [Rhodobacteraceae bacterium]|jgi:MFS family permease|nr:MFS transporter [Paracoccaceae bacterium]
MSISEPLGATAPATWGEVLRDTPAFPVILVTVAAHMTMFGMLTPVMAVYAQGFGIPGWQIGLMITMFAVGRLAADMPAGLLSDRVGLKVLLWGGPLLCALGSALGAAAGSYEALLAGRTVQGVGSGLYMTATMIYVARHSDSRSRAKMMSLYQGAMLVGASFGPAAGGLAAGIAGPQGPFLAACVIGAGTAVLARVMFRDTPPVAGTVAKAGQHVPLGLILALPFLSILAVNFGVFLTRTAAQWQMIPLLADERYGAGPDQIGYAITLSALATLAVLPLAAWLIERVSRPPLIVLSLLATAACLIWVVAAPSMAGLTAAMIGMGLASGISGPAVGAYSVEVAPPDRHGPAMGALRFAGDLGYLIGPMSIGVVIDVFAIGQAGGLVVNAGLLVAFAASLTIATLTLSRRNP